MLTAYGSSNTLHRVTCSECEYVIMQCKLILIKFKKLQNIFLHFETFFTLVTELNKRWHMRLFPDNENTLGNQRKISVEGFNISSLYSRQFLKVRFNKVQGRLNEQYTRAKSICRDQVRGIHLGLTIDLN